MELIDDNHGTDDSAFMSVVVIKALNQLKRYTMRWDIYDAWSNLIIREVVGSLFSLYSKAGVAQGDHLSIVFTYWSSYRLFVNLASDANWIRINGVLMVDGAGADDYNHLKKNFDLNSHLR